jgi:hypothetical protein
MLLHLGLNLNTKSGGYIIGIAKQLNSGPFSARLWILALAEVYINISLVFQLLIPISQNV